MKRRDVYVREFTTNLFLELGDLRLQVFDDAVTKRQHLHFEMRRVEGKGADASRRLAAASNRDKVAVTLAVLDKVEELLLKFRRNEKLSSQLPLICSLGRYGARLTIV